VPAVREVSARDRSGANEVCQLIYTSGTTGEPKG
jgi:cyclohexanecarboxylate-CoA ligase